jgi:hypothetical protein
MNALIGQYLLSRALPFRLADDADGTEVAALVIVETRPSFWLPYVVSSAVSTHPGWHLYVFGTPAVHALLNASCKNYDRATRVELPCTRMTVADYSAMLLSREFWTVIRHEHILVFQADCVLVRPTSPLHLRYDYIGAVCGMVHPDRFVMNGGLSLRRRTAMLRAVDKLQARPELLREPEDVAFCMIMRQFRDEFTLPTMDECNGFAIESLGDPETCIGLHGTDKWYCSEALIAGMLASGLGR